MKTTPESAIVAELHAEMKSYLETSFSLDYHDSPHSDDESLKSISFPAGSDDLDPERQPGDLLIRCAALYSILREETDHLALAPRGDPAAARSFPAVLPASLA